MVLESKAYLMSPYNSGVQDNKLPFFLANVNTHFNKHKLNLMF